MKLNKKSAILKNAIKFINRAIVIKYNSNFNQEYV